MGNEIIL
jgi:hypothetical protein